MSITRGGQAKQLLKQAMDGGRGEEIPAADDVGHALEPVVDRHRQMIACGEVPSLNDNVAPDGWVGHLLATGRPLAVLEPNDSFGRTVARTTSVQPPRDFFPALKPGSPLHLRQGAATAPVDRGAVGIAAGRGARDLRPAAEARVDDASRPETLERRRIVVVMLALPTWQAVESHAEPREIIKDRRLVGGLAARSIEVFNAQQQASAGLLGPTPVEKCGIGVSKMECAVGRRGKPKDRTKRDRWPGA